MQRLIDHCCDVDHRLDPIENKADFDKLSDQLINDVFDGKISKKQIPGKLYQETAKLLQGGASSKLGIYTYADPRNALKSAINANIYAFAGAKSFSQNLELRDQLLDEDGKVKSKGTFRRDAKKIIGQYNDNWLSAEQDTAIGSAQMADNYLDIQKDKELYPNLRYVTVGDDRVSKEHAALEGVVRPVDDDFWDTAYPPNRFRCRCSVIKEDANAKITKKSESSSQLKNAKITKLFRNNTGKSGLLFNEDFPYFKSYKANKINLNELDAVANYGLRSVEKILRKKSGLKAAQKAGSKTELDTWLKAQVKKNPDQDKTGFVINESNSERLIHVEKAFKDELISNESLEATELINTIKLADEIWTSYPNKAFSGTLESVYLRYYKDSIFTAVVRTELANGTVKLKSFKQLSSPSKSEELRRGILELKNYGATR